MKWRDNLDWKCLNPGDSVFDSYLISGKHHSGYISGRLKNVSDPTGSGSTIPIQTLFSVLISDVDPDPRGSALSWLLWIRIRIGNADPDLDPWAWKLTKIKRINRFPAFHKGFCTYVIVAMFGPVTGKFTSSDFKVWPELHGSALVGLLGFGSALR